MDTSNKRSAAGVYLGPVLFNAFINHLEKVTECTLIKHADDTKLVGSVNTLKSRAAVRRNQGRLEECADRNIMNFSKDNCKFLCLGGNNPCNDTGWGMTHWGAALLKMTWGSAWTAGCTGASSGPWQ